MLNFKKIKTRENKNENVKSRQEGDQAQMYMGCEFPQSCKSNRL